MKKIQLIVLMYLLSPIAFAADYGTGKTWIKHVGGYGSGMLVFVYTENNQISADSCNTKNRWVIDLSSPGGEEQYALILAAYMSGKEVKVTSKDSCVLWHDFGDVHNIGFLNF